LQQHALELKILGFRLVWHEADESQGLAFGLGEGGGFVQGGIVEKIAAALGEGGVHGG
jgi:hypothetical protein